MHACMYILQSPKYLPSLPQVMIFKSRSQTKFDLIKYFAYALILKGSDTLTLGWRHLCYISSFINSLPPPPPPQRSWGFERHPSVRSSGIISQYLLPIFDAFLVLMIRTMDSRYHISVVKIDRLTLELLPLT